MAGPAFFLSYQRSDYEPYFGKKLQNLSDQPFDLIFIFNLYAHAAPPP